MFPNTIYTVMQKLFFIFLTKGLKALSNTIGTLIVYESAIGYNIRLSVCINLEIESELFLESIRT